jgi:hypothetical protein
VNVEVAQDVLGSRIVHGNDAEDPPLRVQRQAGTLVRAYLLQQFEQFACTLRCQRFQACGWGAWCPRATSLLAKGLSSQCTRAAAVFL